MVDLVATRFVEIRVLTPIISAEGDDSILLYVDYKTSEQHEPKLREWHAQDKTAKGLFSLYH